MCLITLPILSTTAWSLWKTQTDNELTIQFRKTQWTDYPNQNIHVFPGGGGGGRDSPVKMMGVLGGNFEKNPLKVPECQLAGLVPKNFQPLKVPPL